MCTKKCYHKLEWNEIKTNKKFKNKALNSFIISRSIHRVFSRHHPLTDGLTFRTFSNLSHDYQITWDRVLHSQIAWIYCLILCFVICFFLTLGTRFFYFARNILLDVCVKIHYTHWNFISSMEKSMQLLVGIQFHGLKYFKIVTEISFRGWCFPAESFFFFFFSTIFNLK